jgi:hypothetical protein
LLLCLPKSLYKEGQAQSIVAQIQISREHRHGFFWIDQVRRKNELIGKEFGATSPSTLNIIATNRDRTSDLQIFSLTLSQLSYRGFAENRLK